LSTIETENTRNFKDMRRFMTSIKRTVIGNIRKQLLRNNNLKVNIVAFLGYQRNDEFQEMNFKTRNEIITQTTNLDEFYLNVVNKILEEIETFEIRGSQWVLDSILRIELRMNRYTPLIVVFPCI
jgi:hypothetical protein